MFEDAYSFLKKFFDKNLKLKKAKKGLLELYFNNIVYVSFASLKIN